MVRYKTTKKINQKKFFKQKEKEIKLLKSKRICADLHKINKKIK